MDDNPRLILCPYCGNTQSEPEDRCGACGGYFDSLSLKVTQQHMGPWFIRDRHRPFRPGASYEVIKREIEKGRIKATTILRGPTTRQFWSVARNVPGVAHLLGYCHACGAHCKPNDESCSECGEVFFAPKLRDNLGLAPAGADVQARTKLSETGAPAAGAPTSAQTAGRSAAAAAGGPGISRFGGPSLGPATPQSAQPQSQPTPQPKPQTPAPPQPTTDQPVGSPILAGLRSDQSRSFDQQPIGDAATVGRATSQADRARQAMSWMTGEGEADTLATAGDRTAPLPPNSANVWTWVLIGLNVALFAGVIFFAIIYYGQRIANTPGTQQTSPDQQQPAPADENDNGNGAGNGGEGGTQGGNGASAADAQGDVADVSDPGAATIFDFGEDVAANPPTPDPDGAAAGPDPAQQWRQAYNQAMALADDGNHDRAIAELERIAREAPRDARPADLAQAIAQVRKDKQTAEARRVFMDN